MLPKVEGSKKRYKGGGGVGVGEGNDIGSVYIRVIKPSTHCTLPFVVLKRQSCKFSF